MCYEQACFEAEAQAHQEEQYAEYLDSLLKDGLFNIYALHFAIDLLNTREFKESGLDARRFFSKKLEKFHERVKGEGSKNSDFPF